MSATPVNSYQVLENIRCVSNTFNAIKQPETALLNSIRIGGPVFNKKHFWWDDIRKPISTTIKTAYDQSADSGVLVLTSTEGLRVGNLISVEGQIKRVTVVTNSTTITTTHVGGSADADIAQDKVVTFMFGGALEGAEFAEGNYQPKVERYNVSEIFTGFVKITGTELAIQREINGDLFLDEVQRELEVLRLGLGRKLWINPLVAPTDNLTPRLMGGVENYIAANGYCPASAAFSVDAFDTFLLTLKTQKGWTGNQIWMNPSEMGNFTGVDSTSLLKNYNDTTIGRTVNRYISKHGIVVDLNTDVQCPAKALYATDPALMELKPLNGREFFYGEIAKTGDARKGMIIGEYTLEMRNSATMGKYTIS